MTKLPPAEQLNLKRVVLANALNSLNAPAPYDDRVDILLPFVAVMDVEALDPSDDRDVHHSEKRRVMVPRVFAVNKDGSRYTKPCALGSGEAKPFPIVQMIRELADSGDQPHDRRLPNGGLRWKLYGQQH